MNTTLFTHSAGTQNRIPSFAEKVVDKIHNHCYNSPINFIQKAMTKRDLVGISQRAGGGVIPVNSCEPIQSLPSRKPERIRY